MTSEIQAGANIFVVLRLSPFKYVQGFKLRNGKRDLYAMFEHSTAYFYLPIFV